MNQSKRTWMISTGLIAYIVLSYLFSTHNALIYILNAVIFIELYRTLWEFLVKEDNRIKMRYVIDAGFVFVFKELYLAWILLKDEYNKGLSLLIVYGVSVLLLILIRIVLEKYSPSNTKENKNDYCK